MLFEIKAGKWTKANIKNKTKTFELKIKTYWAHTSKKLTVSYAENKKSVFEAENSNNFEILGI